MSVAELQKTVQRWTACRKLALVDAIHHGYLDKDEMLSLHGISQDEFESWVIKRFEEGPNALMQTALQRFPAVRVLPPSEGSL